MTAQIGESLQYEGKKLTMTSIPLYSFFKLNGVEPSFSSNSTALWRGYIGEWEVINERLYLTSISGELTDGSKASLTTIFPDYPDRVFAHWYTGSITIPEGKLLKYVHMGFGSIYERDIILTFKKGVMIKKNIINNGKSNNTEGSEGYGVGALTIRSGSKK